VTPSVSSLRLTSTGVRLPVTARFGERNRPPKSTGIPASCCTWCCTTRYCSTRKGYCGGSPLASIPSTRCVSGGLTRDQVPPVRGSRSMDVHVQLPLVARATRHPNSQPNCSLDQLVALEAKASDPHRHSSIIPGRELFRQAAQHPWI
jgi:hypothetical protein